MSSRSNGKPRDTRPSSAVTRHASWSARRGLCRRACLGARSRPPLLERQRARTWTRRTVCPWRPGQRRGQRWASAARAYAVVQGPAVSSFSQLECSLFFPSPRIAQQPLRYARPRQGPDEYFLSETPVCTCYVLLGPMLIGARFFVLRSATNLIDQSAQRHIPPAATHSRS